MIQSDIRELRILAEDNSSDREMRDLALKDLQEIQESLTALQDQVSKECAT